MCTGKLKWTTVRCKIVHIIGKLKFSTVPKVADDLPGSVT